MNATGHSHSSLSGSGAGPDGCEEPAPGLLLQGIEEFNEGYYWQCHETLEQLWRAEPRPVRGLYQGILQVGVGFHHLRRANYPGAAKMLGRGLARLKRLPDVCQEVQVARLQDAAQSVYDRILELGPIRLQEFDMSGLPSIELQTSEAGKTPKVWQASRSSPWR